MEWYDLFRLPLVLFWIIPAILVLGAVSVAVIIPVAVLAGFGLHLKDLVRRRLRGRRKPVIPVIP